MTVERATLEDIESRLRAGLEVHHVEIEDESHLHAGHAGAASGGGHFRSTIVSPNFEGLSALRRHRLVYTALGDLMSGPIHAFNIRALTPAEHEPPAS